MSVAIAIETPLQDDMRALIGELNDAIDAQEPDTPSEFKFRMTVEEMAGPETTVWVARLDGAAVGCGALRRHGDNLGEIKRMYVRPSAQGRGVAASLLAAIEAHAAAGAFRALALETGGDGYASARRLYERAGYTRCGAFADYPDSAYSTFYRKDLCAAPAAS